MKALVTGGAGFVGVNLVRHLLKEGYRVTVLDDLSSGSRGRIPAGAEFTKGNILNNRAVQKASKGADVVFHLAAKISVPWSIKNPAKTMEINTIGTVNLLEANKDVDSFIYASSAAVYGDPIKIPIPEEHPLNPLSPYGASKICAEICCKNYQNIYGMKIAVLRPFNIYGPFQDPKNPYSGVISKFISYARKGQPLTIFGDGNDTRDYIYIDDVCDAFLTAINREGVFNVGTGRTITTNELAKLIQNIGGKDLRIAHVPPRHGDIRESCADITKLARLGWRPKIVLPSGLRELYKCASQK